ncbi:unnamed protein product [Symbiodinium pilosum]|uniref:Uncharacterized protein n=1 Tax=Symbiodinium pilosum TaxID=2952 RepID=A0A812YHS0_SYMPI|nr:unnamed protein product [Symbiodinium pilosum]
MQHGLPPQDPPRTESSLSLVRISFVQIAPTRCQAPRITDRTSRSHVRAAQEELMKASAKGLGGACTWNRCFQVCCSILLGMMLATSQVLATEEATEATPAPRPRMYDREGILTRKMALCTVSQLKEAWVSAL